jgi:hypothetical protein
MQWGRYIWKLTAGLSPFVPRLTFQVVFFAPWVVWKPVTQGGPAEKSKGTISLVWGWKGSATRSRTRTAQQRLRHRVSRRIGTTYPARLGDPLSSDRDPRRLCDREARQASPIISWFRARKGRYSFSHYLYERRRWQIAKPCSKSSGAHMQRVVEATWRA